VLAVSPLKDIQSLGSTVFPSPDPKYLVFLQFATNGKLRQLVVLKDCSKQQYALCTLAVRDLSGGQKAEVIHKPI
jgi:hypothetical protein